MAERVRHRCSINHTAILIKALWKALVPLSKVTAKECGVRVMEDRGSQAEELLHDVFPYYVTVMRILGERNWAVIIISISQIKKLGQREIE